MRVGSTNTEDHQQCRERPVFHFMSFSVTIADFPINENSLSGNRNAEGRFHRGSNDRA